MKEQSSGLYAQTMAKRGFLAEGAPFFVKDYHDYYKTPRGYYPL